MIALYILGCLFALVAYLRIGRAIGELSWRVWESPWDTRKMRILAAVCFPQTWLCCANTCQERWKWINAEDLERWYKKDKRHDGDFRKHLILNALVWPLKIIWTASILLVYGFVVAIRSFSLFALFGRKPIVPPVITAEPKVEEPTKQRIEELSELNREQADLKRRQEELEERQLRIEAALELDAELDDTSSHEARKLQ